VKKMSEELICKKCGGLLAPNTIHGYKIKVCLPCRFKDIKRSDIEEEA